MMATGVASPNAHGQEITRILIPMERANSKVAPVKSQTTTATAAMAMTTGTKIPAILSAILAIGAFEELASSTKRIICENVVSSPTLVAFTRTKPALLIVAAMTLSPGCFSTGMLSPVIAASSMLVAPSMISPSTGMLCPGLTCTISPAVTSSIGTSMTSPLRST